MLQNKRFLYVGFMCCQAVEKLLKGIYVKDNADAELPYTHSLLKLANKTKLSEEMTSEQIALLSILQPLNVEARYPSSKERLARALNENYCRELITRTEALLAWIKEQA